MRFYLIIFLIAACTAKEQMQEDSALDSTQQQLSIGSIVYRDSLHALPYEFESNRRGLIIFNHVVDKHESNNCDEALKDFFAFQNRLINELNQKLYTRPDYETINTLIWADTTLYAPAAVRLQKQLKQQGLLFLSTEGSIYIDADTEPIRTTFYECLSKSTKLFFEQYEFETNQGFAEDGGMYISEKELADRLGFWEEFVMNNPNHVFKDYADNNLKYYRYYLMMGMDNTPAFDYESGKLLNEYELALIYYQQRYSKTPSARIYKDYLTLLAKQGNRLVGDAAKFPEKYLPWPK